MADAVNDPLPDTSTRSGHVFGSAAVLFIAGALVLAMPWLSGIVTIPWDAKAQAWPQLVFLAHSLARGESPFWTPNVFAGHPQIADPQSLIFSPPFLLLAWLVPEPTFRQADSVVFGMLILAGLAIIALFRDRGWHPAGALVAAFAFAFGGSAAWRIQHIGEVVSLSWFVIACWLLERTLSRANPACGGAAGLVAAFMVLGRDQIAYLCTLILVARVLTHLLAGPDVMQRLRRLFLPLGVGLTTGLAVVSLPLALTLSLAAISNRPEIDFAGAGRGSLPPLSFLTAVAANLFGTDGPLRDFWGPPVAEVWGATDIALARNMGDIYFGALPLVALLTAGLGGAALAARPIRFVTGAALAMGFFAVGRNTPFFALAYFIPGVDLYRRPADATFPLAALLAIGAGYCIHHWLASPARRLQPGLILSGAALVACIAVAIWKGRLEQAEGSLLTAAALLSLAAMTIALLPRLWAVAPGLALSGLAVIMTFDLALSNRPNESTGLPPETYDVLRAGTANETIALIRRRLADTAAPDRRDRVELAAVDFEWPNAGLVHGFDHDLGYNPVRLKLFTDATHAIDQVALPDQRTFSPLYAGFRSPMADLLGVRLVVSRYPLEQMDPGFRPGDLDLIARTKDAFVWENPRALPRVLLATEARPANFDAMLEDGNWPAFDPRRTVLLQSSIPDDDTPRSPGTARILSYRNTDIVIEAVAPDGGFVVLNDVWHPWWFAELDGEPVELLRANVIFRAVRVPPGSHRVRFAFRPLAGLWREIATRR